MAAFLKDIRPFLGTGEKNEENQTLEEFLEEYDPQRYKNPAVTADVLVFKYSKERFEETFAEKDAPLSHTENGLQLLMIKRRNHPSIGLWALPGGFVNIEEDLEAAAKRELEEETGVTGLSLEMVNTYGEADRDPRYRIITAAYVALIEEDLNVNAGDDAADACFLSLALRQVSTEEVSVGNKAKELTRYELKAFNQEKGLKLKATVERSRNKKGLLKETKFKVISSEGFAFDHPRFIAETLFYIQERL